MDFKKGLACFVLGFSLADGFNVMSNPFTEPGFVRNAVAMAKDPGMLVAGVIVRPVDTLAPFLLAAGAGVYLYRGRKKSKSDLTIDVK